MNPLRQLQARGQAVWLDYIRRDILLDGSLRRMVEEDGVSGVTSNPAIFQKAIGESDLYDQAIQDYLKSEPHGQVERLYEALVVEDIRLAADILMPVFEATGGRDGFVSLEVSPHLARDADGSVAEARHLWGLVDRPNLMIKVPATTECIPAIEQLLGEGINVNVTLMFSLAHYEAVSHAYLRGLERCQSPERLASVASFFVSRVDTKVDGRLEELGGEAAAALLGTIAIANSKLTYARYQELFEGAAFQAMRDRGAESPLGQHQYQKPRISRCNLRRGAHWSRYGQHDSAADSGGFQGPRESRAHSSRRLERSPSADSRARQPRNRPGYCHRGAPAGGAREVRGTV